MLQYTIHIFHLRLTIYLVYMSESYILLDYLCIVLILQLNAIYICLSGDVCIMSLMTILGVYVLTSTLLHS